MDSDDENDIPADATTNFTIQLNQTFQTVPDLQNALRQVWKMLHEKEQDLVTAAELGKDLIETNQALQTEKEALLLKISTLENQPKESMVSTNVHAKTLEQLSELERLHQKQTQELELLRLDHENLKKSNSSLEKSLSIQIAKLQQDLDTTSSQLSIITTERDTLTHQLAELKKKTTDTTSLEQEYQMFQTQLLELETKLQQSLQQSLNHETCLQESQQENLLLQHKCQQLEDRITSLSTVSQDLTLQQNRSMELEQQLEEERELVSKMRRALNGDEKVEAALRASGNLQEQRDSKADAATLFSEVEDRRIALENQHLQLTQKHKGLLKVHHQNVHQQEQMRSHISRLTQIAQTRKDQDRIHRLEAALQQKESENRELTLRLSALESSVIQHEISEEQVGGDAPADNASISTLRFRISSMEASFQALQKELSTLRMLRLSEAEKIRVMERNLGEVEESLEDSKSQATRWKWEYEQLREKLTSLGHSLPPIEEVVQQQDDLEIPEQEVVESSVVEDVEMQEEPPVVDTAPKRIMVETLQEQDENAFKLVKNSKPQPVPPIASVAKSAPKQVFVSRANVAKNTNEECKQQ